MHEFSPQYLSLYRNAELECRHCLHLGYIHALTENINDSREMHRRALDIAKRHSLQDEQCEALMALSDVEQLSGNISFSIGLLNRVVEVAPIKSAYAVQAHLQLGL